VSLGILQKVNLQIYTVQDCTRAFEAYRPPLKIHASNICAGTDAGYKGQCSGDSGGPLLVNGIQVGIVSWSVKPCAVPPFPGVYTAVASYADWITARTGIDFKLNMFIQAQ
jgi:trypsin